MKAKSCDTLFVALKDEIVTRI